MRLDTALWRAIAVYRVAALLYAAGSMAAYTDTYARPRLGRVGIRIGRPLDFSRYAGMEGDRFVLRSITDEVMYELMVLSGQEYVDQYATKAKAEIELARAAARESLVSDAPAPVRRAS